MTAAERIPDLVEVRICDGAMRPADQPSGLRWRWWVEVVDDEGGVLVDYVGECYERARECAIGWELPVIDNAERRVSAFVLIDGGRA